MAFQNQEIGYTGQNLTIDAHFRVYTGGPLTDTDALPTFQVYSPSNILITSGTGVQTSTGVYTATFAVPPNAEVGNKWRIVWTAAIATNPVEGAVEYFTVLPNPNAPVFSGGTLIQISDLYLNQVKKVLGAPIVDDIVLTDDEIKELCVYHAFRDYFTKFPKPEKAQIEFNGTVEVDFPDADTYGLLDLRATNKMTSAGGSINSSFWEIIKYRNLYGTANARWGGGAYGTRYNFDGMTQNLFTRKQMYDAIQNEGTYTYEIDYITRKIRAFSSSLCSLTITWGKHSNNFEDVKYVYQFDVIKLAQSYLLSHLADLGGIITDNNLEKSINVDALRARATELKTEVVDKWAQIPDVILIRGA